MQRHRTVSLGQWNKAALGDRHTRGVFILHISFCTSHSLFLRCTKKAETTKKIKVPAHFNYSRHIKSHIRQIPPDFYWCYFNANIKLEKPVESIKRKHTWSLSWVLPSLRYFVFWNPWILFLSLIRTWATKNCFPFTFSFCFPFSLLTLFSILETNFFLFWW